MAAARDAGAESGAAPVRVLRFGADGLESSDDAVAVEEPLEIRLQGASLAVVMRTPGHDRELVLGFLVTERVVASPTEVTSVRHTSLARDPKAADNVVSVVLAPGTVVDLDALRRNFFASSSCGICGKASIENALATAPPLDDPSRFAPAYFLDLVAQVEAAQAVFGRTGGLHAAGLFGPDGRLLVSREDVGRHNAVDKVVGWALENGSIPLSGHALVVSGRVSFEIVQKALTARIPVVAAVSAPTSLAVEFAQSAGLTLVGFLRGRGFNVYSGHERLEVV